MDESRFKRHGNIGHRIQSGWIFGICERENGWDRTYFVPVPNRNQDTLGNIVQWHVNQNSQLVITDVWRVLLLK